MASVLFVFALCSRIVCHDPLGGEDPRQLEAFGERSVLESRPSRRWGTIRARLLQQVTQAQRLLGGAGSEQAGLRSDRMKNTSGAEKAVLGLLPFRKQTH